MSVDVCTHICMWIGIDICIDMCIDMCTDMCKDTCIDMCIDLSMHMSVHMSMHMCIHLRRLVLRLDLASQHLGAVGRLCQRALPLVQLGLELRQDMGPCVSTCRRMRRRCLRTMGAARSSKL